MVGNWPELEINHKNQNPLDNRWSNLYSDEHSVNMKNKKKYQNNSSGYTGIYKRGNNWRVQIRVKGKTINIATVNSIEEALHLREEAQKEYKFDEQHGK